TADAGPILASAGAEWLPVFTRHFKYHDKPGGTDSVRAEFSCGFVLHKLWLCPEHKGFAKHKADRFWRDHGGAVPAARSVTEWLKRQGELMGTEQISIKPAGKYYEVTGYRAAGAAANDNDISKKNAA